MFLLCSRSSNGFPSRSEQNPKSLPDSIGLCRTQTSALSSFYRPLTFHMLATIASSLLLDTSNTFPSQGLFTCYHSAFLSPLLHSDFCSMSSLFRVSPCHLSKIVLLSLSSSLFLVCFYFQHHLYISLSIYVGLSVCLSSVI